MEDYIIDTKEEMQLSTRAVRQMATQGIGHSKLSVVADIMSGKSSIKEKTKPVKKKTKSTKRKTKRRTKKQIIADAKKAKYVNPLTNRKCSYNYALKNGFITEEGKSIPLEEMKFKNPETGRMVSYTYAKKKGLI